MEAGHHDYKLEWENVKVSANDEDYGEKMVGTVVRKSIFLNLFPELSVILNI